MPRAMPMPPLRMARYPWQGVRLPGCPFIATPTSRAVQSLPCPCPTSAPAATRAVQAAWA